MHTIISVTSPLTPLHEGEVITNAELIALRKMFGATFTVLSELEAGQYTIRPVDTWRKIKQPKERWGIFQAHYNHWTESVTAHEITIHDTLSEARQALVERLEKDDRLYKTLARDNWVFQNSRTI